MDRVLQQATDVAFCYVFVVKGGVDFRERRSPGAEGGVGRRAGPVVVVVVGGGGRDWRNATRDTFYPSFHSVHH